MDKWGHKLHDAVIQVAEMAAIGLGLEKDRFVQLAPNQTILELNYPCHQLEKNRVDFSSW